MTTIEFDVVNVRTHYSTALLHRFYNELMVPNFPIEEELDDVQLWEASLDPNLAHERDERDPEMQILLALEKYPVINEKSGISTTVRTTRTPSHDPESATVGMGFNSVNYFVREDVVGWTDRRILGGIVYEYYPYSRCALISYIVADPTVRRTGVIGRLHKVCLFDLDRLSSTGHGLRAVFVETNAPGFDDGVMDNNIRHQVLYRLGYRQVQCLYNQPPLKSGEKACENLTLLVLKPQLPVKHLSGNPIAHQQTSHLNTYDQARIRNHGHEGIYEENSKPIIDTITKSNEFIPAQWVSDFVREFARSTLGHEDDSAFVNERYWGDMQHSLGLYATQNVITDNRPNVRVVPTLPLQTRLGCLRYHVVVVCDQAGEGGGGGGNEDDREHSERFEHKIALRLALRLKENIGCMVTILCGAHDAAGSEEIAHTLDCTTASTEGVIVIREWRVVRVMDTNSNHDNTNIHTPQCSVSSTNGTHKHQGVSIVGTTDREVCEEVASIALSKYTFESDKGDTAHADCFVTIGRGWLTTHISRDAVHVPLVHKISADNLLTETFRSVTSLLLKIDSSQVLQD